MIVSSLPPVTLAAFMLFLAMGMLGMGYGAVFQIVPQRSPANADVELTTGFVGVAGGPLKRTNARISRAELGRCEVPADRQ